MESEVTHSTMQTLRGENDPGHEEDVQTLTQTPYADSSRESSRTPPRPNLPLPEWQRRINAKNMARRVGLETNTPRDNKSHDTEILDVIYLSDSQAGHSAISVKDSQRSKHILSDRKQANISDKTTELKKKCIDILEKEWGKNFYKQLPAWPESPGKSFLQFLVMLASTQKIPLQDFREGIAAIYHKRIAEKPELKGYDRYIKISDAKAFLERYKVDTQYRIANHKAPEIRSSPDQQGINQPDIRPSLVRKRTVTFLEPDIDHSDRNPRRQRLESTPLEASTPDNGSFQPSTIGSIASDIATYHKDAVAESREQDTPEMPSIVVESSLTSQSTESHSADPAKDDDCLRSSTRNTSTANVGIPIDSPEPACVTKEFMSTSMSAPQNPPLESNISIQSRDGFSAELGVFGQVAVLTRQTVATAIEHTTILCPDSYPSPQTTVVNDRGLTYDNLQSPTLTQQKHDKPILLIQNTPSPEQAQTESRNGIESNASTTDRNLDTYHNITMALNKISQPINVFQEQIEVLKNGINHLQAQLEAQNKENTCLVDERSQSKIALVNFTTQNDHLQAENLELKAKISELSRLVEERTCERDDLAMKVQGFERMLQSIKSITLDVPLQGGVPE